MPIMYVVAGPSGSGKTSAFPVSRFGCDYFNADDHAAQLNGGSYVGIPKSIRAIVGPICEKFIQDHIAADKDFATETTFAQHNRIRSDETGPRGRVQSGIQLYLRR
jgi:predicted ABC-type ATPase